MKFNFVYNAILNVIMFILIIINYNSMSQDKDNGKIILIATIICVVIGLVFVFRLDQKIVNLFKSNNNIQVEDYSNVPELQNLPELPNMVVVYLGSFLDKEITIKEGEVVTFYNVDQNPAKIIGDGWQSAFIDKTGTFAKGDFAKGEYTAYLDGKPNEVIKIKVK